MLLLSIAFLSIPQLSVKNPFFVQCIDCRNAGGLPQSFGSEIGRGADAAPAQSESMVPVGRAAHRRPYDGVTGDEGIAPTTGAMGDEGIAPTAGMG